MRASDFDGYSDGEEMGEFQSSAEHPYFKRVSSPIKTTYEITENLTIGLPEKTYYDTQIESSKNVIKLWTYTENKAYEEENDHETLITPHKNVKIELIDIPSAFKLEDINTSETSTENGNVVYKTTARLSFSQNANISGAKWKISASGGHWWTAAVNPIQVKYTVNHDLLNDAEACMEQLETEFITQLCNDASNTTTQETQSLEDLKKQITAYKVSFANSKYTASSIPDDVYEAFARAILDTLTSSNVDRYKFDLDKPTQLPEEVYKQISKGLASDSFSISLSDGSNRRTYTVEYSIAAMVFLGISGGYAEATVSWSEAHGRESWKLVWASNYKAGLNALSNYCSVLFRLELDVWKDFIASFVSDLLGLKKKNVRNVLYVAEDVIMAMCGDTNAADTLAKGTDNMKLKELIKAGLDKLVLKFFPNGKKFVDATNKLDSVIKRRKTLEKALADYNTAKDKNKADAEITYAYKRFKADYNKLKEIDLFNGKFPELKVNDYTFPNL